MAKELKQNNESVVELIDNKNRGLVKIHKEVGEAVLPKKDVVAEMVRSQNEIVSLTLNDKIKVEDANQIVSALNVKNGFTARALMKDGE